MAIDLRCPGCGKTLRVGDEHAGRQVRCPACQKVATAPAATPSPDASSWQMRTPEGSTYGPATWEEVEAWAAEGRIEADCELRTAAGGPWQRASVMFPMLQGTKPRPAESARPTGPTTYPWTPQATGLPSGGWNPPANSSAVPATLAAAAGGYHVPHRGGLILVLGLLGFMITCPVFSLLAWVMGSHDLREMRSGRMDPSGEGLTQAGQIMGMVLSLLWIAGGVLLLGLMGLVALSR
jgi:phage FluMu protein Com